MTSLRPYFTHRLIWLALLVSLGIGALFARTIWTMRGDEWNYARQTNANLVRTLEKGLLWSLDSFDKSLAGVAREVARPEVWALPPDLRARVVFDNSLRTRGVGDVLVLDERGEVVLDSGSIEPRKLQLADRDYFVAFQSGGHQGLFVGQPTFARTTGIGVLPLARAYHHADGRFAGVVVGVIRLSYFNEIFGALDLGRDSGVTFLRADGVLIARFPYSAANVGQSFAGTPNVLRFQSDRSGAFTGKAAIDGVERFYVFQKVGDYPLILSVAQSTDTILANWRHSAWGLGMFAALLMAACLGLALLFVRELTLRQQVSARLREAERQVRAVIDNTPSLIGYWDDQLRNRFANQAHCDWHGIPRDALRGQHASDMLPPTLYPTVEPHLRRALQGEPQLFERSFTDAQGRLRHIIVSCVPDRGDDGQVRGFYSQITDITERKRMEDELFDEKERMRFTLQAIGDAVVTADAGGRLTYLNPVAERLTGWQAFDAASRPVDEVLDLRTPGGGEALPSPLRTAIEQAAVVDTVRGEIVQRASGRRFRMDGTVSPITDRHGHVTGAVAVLRDVTEATAMAERMNHLAHYDALTDLPNRVLLHDRAQHAIVQARRSGQTLAVMYLDLDGFKAVNDTLGHEAGDLLLVQFAQRLKAAVRASDTVCRQGGDEFVVLLPDLPGLDGAGPACQVARKILASCQAPFDLNGREARVGLSGGIALYPAHGDTFDALSRHADGALYAAKRGGRMRVMLYQGPQAPPQAILLSDA
ncbi:MAG: diguanylate cyclase [Acidovorax sp.]|uniref:bifunctional diguanylate cyclase/phosphodiesterase n=1 Tax=Acidovorax sp. TaxID=1872122 RepID=UPI0039E5DCEF